MPTYFFKDFLKIPTFQCKSRILIFFKSQITYFKDFLLNFSVFLILLLKKKLLYKID